MDCKFTKMPETGSPIQATIKPNHHYSYNLQTQMETNPRLWQHQPFAAPPSLPIDDFHLTENPGKYTEDERQLRIKLAAVYRLIELNGWSMGIYNHVTAKLDKQHEKILIHPFGLHYNEITASSLLKIDMSGNIVDQGTTNFELNRPGYIIHSAIHLARPDLKAIIHLHYPPVSAASASKHGLLPICQEQALLGDIAYLDYSGILTQEDERDAVAAAFGDKRKVMILHNHGLIVCGETIEEAFYLLTNLMRACETQARLIALGGIESLVLMNEEAAKQAHDMVQNARYPIKQLVNNDDDERSDESTTSGNESDMDQADHRIKAQMQAKKGLKKKIVGYVNMFELDFEANMRALDASGHQTGYKYKRPLVRHYKRM
uniref:Alpha-adducin n=1 Tax=Aceria tosichella TaxID=561515 RepID=A0A6G1SBT3_9ACAR